MFVDTTVFMDAAGTEHPLRGPSRAVLERIGGGLEATTSVEVVQEIVHRYLAIGRAEVGIAMATAVMDLFAPVLPMTHATMRRVPALADRYPTLSARGLVHAATCLTEGIESIVSPDRGFDQLREIRRLDPVDLAMSGDAAPAAR